MSLTRRVAARLISTAVAILITIFMRAPEAYAGNCDGPLCGAVKNRTDGVIHITTSIREHLDRPGETPDWCDVWNWKGGTDRVWHHAACKQQTRSSNGIFGGNNTGYDVDAFTFANHGYHVRRWRTGKWHWEKKGVWTKIRNGEIADCGVGKGNEVWCTLLIQASA